MKVVVPSETPNPADGYGIPFAWRAAACDSFGNNREQSNRIEDKGTRCAGARDASGDVRLSSS